MRLKHSKLPHIQTSKLLEHFVAGTPARTACLLIGVNKIMATDFHHRLRIVISEKLAAEVAELAGEIEVMKAISAVYGRVSGDEAPPEKSLSSVS